jgi:hypothetical protein
VGQPDPGARGRREKPAAERADIVREPTDGAARLQADDDNLRAHDQTWWENYRNQLERVAQEASRRVEGLTS